MKIENLPLSQELETKAVLKAAINAQRYLGELQGVAKTIPNEEILLNLLPLQEARCSSEIENIVTTSDELYKSRIENNISNATKEVRNYEKALLKGFDTVKEKKRLTNNMICDIQKILIGNEAGFRKQRGTRLKNNRGEVIYTPPQDIKQMNDLMQNLETFINDDSISDMNPLVKLAIIHHRFETIHPFYDGNGRTGRIINIFYLHLQGLLDLPILYLSRFIVDHKSDYYRLLQEVREKSNWQDWIVFMLRGIAFSSLETIYLIHEIRRLMLEFKQEIREKYPKIYSQDLINTLFKYPYTRIEFISKDLNITRPTATKYLGILEQDQFLTKMTVGRNHYYVNHHLIDASIQVRKETLEISKQ